MDIKSLLGEKAGLQGKDGMVDVADLMTEGKQVGLYFSAHWCPPCRAFTPKLAKWYSDIKATEMGRYLEIVFISSDREEASFNTYYSEMPWLAIPFKDEFQRDRLGRKFNISGIPKLIFLEGRSGKLLTMDGRNYVITEGKNTFPIGDG